MDICLRPLPPFHSHSHFSRNGDAKVVHMSCNFHLHLTCNFQVFIFKCFRTSRKYQFRLLLGVFLDITPRNVVQLVWNFDQWCNAKVMRPIIDIFYSILDKRSKLVQKSGFLAHSKRFFVYALLHLMSYAPNFCQIKCLIELHNCSKFYYLKILCLSTKGTYPKFTVLVHFWAQCWWKNFVVAQLKVVLFHI